MTSVVRGGCWGSDEEEGLGIRDGAKVALQRTRSVGRGVLSERLGMMEDGKKKLGNAGCSSRGRLLISRYAV